MELYEKYKTQFNKYGVNTPLRIVHWMTQVNHESNFKAVREGLNYSSKGLLKTFSKYFKSRSEADLYARKPEKIANKVYANRMGNGDEKSGDGWKYRGINFLQITGKDNMTALTKATGIDFVGDPQKHMNEADAVISALWFWKVNNLNKYADLDDLDGVSDVINIGHKTAKYGDSNGFKDRKEKYEYYKKMIIK
jgi:putative chitinase